MGSKPRALKEVHLDPWSRLLGTVTTTPAPLGRWGVRFRELLTCGVSSWVGTEPVLRQVCMALKPCSTQHTATHHGPCSKGPSPHPPQLALNSTPSPPHIPVLPPWPGAPGGRVHGEREGLFTERRVLLPLPGPLCWVPSRLPDRGPRTRSEYHFQKGELLNPEQYILVTTTGNAKRLFLMGVFMFVLY